MYRTGASSITPSPGRRAGAPRMGRLPARRARARTEAFNRLSSPELSATRSAPRSSASRTRREKDGGNAERHADRMKRPERPAEQQPGEKADADRQQVEEQARPVRNE